MSAPEMRTRNLLLLLQTQEQTLALIEAMSPADEVVDPEDGLVWRWELQEDR